MTYRGFKITTLPNGSHRAERTTGEEGAIFYGEPEEVSAKIDKFCLDEAIAIIKALMTNEHINLGDKIYDVRDSEGDGWEGKSVVAWGKAVEAADNFLKNLE